MSLTDLQEMILWGTSIVPLVVVLVISICRVNAMRPRTRNTLRIAYIWLAGAAFSLLVTIIIGGDLDPQQIALFAIGVALCFATDRRKSGCFSRPLPDRRSHA